MNAPVAAPRCWVVIPAAGSGQRMAGAAAGPSPAKQYLPLAGATVIEHALTPFLDHPRIAGIVVVVAREDERFRTLGVSAHPRVSTALGGPERAHSVLNGLEALASRAAAHDWVLVHDAARPCLARMELDRLIAQVEDDEVGGLLALPAGDTLKQQADTQQRSAATVDRSRIWRAQTPQMFRFESLRAALREAARQGLPVTDESSAMEARGHSPRLVTGSVRNIKVTVPEDLELAEAILTDGRRGAAMRVGMGFDAHRYGEGDHVMLGGVRIAHTRGIVAHSDGDVLIHALCDALLGAAGLGDIGEHFPDQEPKWRGAASARFLERVVDMLAERGLRAQGADLTLLAEEPRLAPHREAIRTTLARLLGVDAARVNLKATTLERMGFIGRGEGLAAQAIVTVTEVDS
jgi:2-C-methyl-D-erythritol 4-phosphate cytidylyltransferase / 2-C-methyl-D-erythritol 2,4-cyclodiphosphate synthase